MSVVPPAVPHDLEARVRDAVAHIRSRSGLVPHVAFTLGSGLGGVVDAIEDAATFPTGEIPHWPRSTVVGHAGRLALGRWRGVPVVALAGRSHRYEGYSLDRVTFGLRVMGALGARTMILTNAVGAIHPGLEPADLVLASGHINFIGKRGMFTTPELAERRAGRRLATYCDPELAAELARAALAAGVRLHHGTLMGGHGPTYETAAEVRVAARLCADVACMSTVHELTLAAELGARSASISAVTNRATGLSDKPLTHEEVTEVADVAARGLRAILETYLDSIAGEP